jgi:hypothetical protein
MESTDSQLLPYPEPEDFANGSQQLKILAEAIDAKLAALSLGYDTVLARPVILRAATPGGTFAANLDWSVSVPNVIFESPGYLAQAGSTLELFSYPPGIWIAGGYLATNPVGVVDAGTYRITRLRITDRRIQPGTGVSFYEEIWDNSGSQTNTGGDFTTFSQTFEIHDPTNALLQLKLQHGNTSSNLVVNGAFLWTAYIGELAI